MSNSSRFEFSPLLLQRRQEIFRLILLVLCAAALMSFGMGIAVSWVAEVYVLNIWMIVVPTAVLALVLIVASRSYAGRVNKEFQIEIMLPFASQVNMTPLGGWYYKPLKQFQMRSRQFLSRENNDAKKVAAQWRSMVKNKTQTLDLQEQPECESITRFIIDFAEYLVLHTVIRFTQKAFSGGSRYTRFGWTRPTLTKEEETLTDHNLAAFKGNVIVDVLTDDLSKSFPFLAGFKLHRKPFEKQKKGFGQHFELVSRHGRIKFTLSPFPILMPPSRDLEIAARYCQTEPEKMILIKVPVLMKVDIGGFRALGTGFTKLVVPWIEELVERMHHDLDWQYCIQHDLERMVVEMMRGREKYKTQ